MFMRVSPASRAATRPFAPPWTRGRVAALVAAVAVVAAACGSDDAATTGSEPVAESTMPATAPGSASPPTTAAAPDEPTNTPTTDAVDVADLGPTAQRLVGIAVADLVERFDLAESSSAIKVVTVEEVTWRDASVGCPSKGMQYAQVLTPGTRIVLQHDGTSFSYHAGGGRDPFYCPTPQTPVADG